MNQKPVCPICGNKDATSTRDPSHDAFWVSCRKCGYYRISGSLFSALPSTDEKTRIALMIHTRTHYDSNLGPVDVTSALLERGPFELSEVPLPEKIDGIVRFLGKTTSIGSGVDISLEYDFPKFYCTSRAELTALLAHLAEGDLISLNKDRLPDTWGVQLTVTGWYRYYELSNTGTLSKRCFVAMWFDARMDPVWEVIKGCVSECGFAPVRIDKVPHNDYITHRIIAEMKASRFMIADFTGNRGGVYFEAGFMKGQGKEVIFLCQEIDRKDIHFDCQQINFLFWKEPKDLSDTLKDWIRSTIK